MFSMIMKTLQAKKALPQISPTERQALEAGTVWVDGEIFSGHPDMKKMLAEPYNHLKGEERAFLDNEVEQLCRMVDSHEVHQSRVIPEPVIQFMKDKGFFGLLIPKEYGGKDFSTLAISTIMMKLSAHSPLVCTLVVIPNSLGAAELLKHYGTAEQKSHYLPRLANGTYIPCFGLTEPTAGSDAASILARGRAFRDTDGTVKLKLNFSKRYITLAPIASLISLAFKLEDPENLLGKGAEPGITVAMVHRGAPGLEIGMHHEPIGEAFYNGPIVGRDVVIPATSIIGGPSEAGNGWKMLMEQLAGGRAVSLPATAIAVLKGSAASAGPYAKVRQQFGMSIAAMEGIQEKIAHLAAMAYLGEASRVFGCSAVDNNQQPPVVSAILKAYLTEMGRQASIDAMDIFSGAGVMQGPNNIIARGYTCAPVAITVEGANIMTRTLIVFGQGAVRCHPYALKVVHAVENNDVPAFRSALLGWVGHMVANSVRTLVRGITRGASAGSPVEGATATYYKRLAWSASRYALLTDMALFGIGGKLKARGQITGRYADALAWQFMAFATLRRYEAEGRQAADLPLVQYACDYALAQVQKAFEAIYQNFGGGLLGTVLRTVGSLWLRMNPVGRLPADHLAAPCAQALLTMGGQYTRVTEYMPLPMTEQGTEAKATGRLMHAFKLVSEAEPIMHKINAARRDARYKGKIAKGHWSEVLESARQLGIISAQEAALVESAEHARLNAIQVDAFTPQQFLRDPSVNGVPGFTNDVPPGAFDKRPVAQVIPLQEVA